VRSGAYTGRPDTNPLRARLHVDGRVWRLAPRHCPCRPEEVTEKRHLHIRLGQPVRRGAEPGRGQPVAQRVKPRRPQLIPAPKLLGDPMHAHNRCHTSLIAPRPKRRVRARGPARKLRRCTPGRPPLASHPGTAAANAKTSRHHSARGRSGSRPPRAGAPTGSTNGSAGSQCGRTIPPTARARSHHRSPSRRTHMAAY
jgi:hypothetical protein